MEQAPPDWYYHLFPLTGEGEEIEIDAVVRRAHGLINLARESNDQAHLGTVLHWAHLLKADQGKAADWPARVNARTGAALGEARTRSPLSLFARLGAILNSSEFEGALDAAKRPGA